MTRQDKWDGRYLAIALQIASWSKDPSTKVGAVVVNGDNRIVSTGFNGFPPGEDDAAHLYTDRAYKYAHVVHAEQSALEQCPTRGCSGFTIYTSFPCCPNCTRAIRARGFRRIVCPPLPTAGKSAEWISQWGDWVRESLAIAYAGGVSMEFRDV